jgi:hypothetical protein
MDIHAARGEAKNPHSELSLRVAFKRIRAEKREAKAKREEVPYSDKVRQRR